MQHHNRLRQLVISLLLAAGTACGSVATAPSPGSSQSRTPTPNTSVPPPRLDATAPCAGVTAPSHYQHVVVIFMENKTLGQILNSPSAPYENSLMRKCGYAANWQDAGVAYDSEPNYVAWATGISDPAALRPYTCDCSPPATADAASCNDGAANCSNDDNIFRQIESRGQRWKAYQENMPANCAESSSGKYAVKHNPAAFFFGGNDHTACQSNDVGSGDVSLYQATSPLALDLANNTLPTLAEITPNICNDMHDCSISTGDAYLSHLLPLILDSQAYKSASTAVVLMWDEDTPTANIVIAPAVAPGTVVSNASHYGCLRAVEEMLGLPLLGAAQYAGAADLRSNFHL